MKELKRSFKYLPLLALLLALLLVACGGGNAANEEPANDANDNSMNDMSDEDMNHNDSEEMEHDDDMEDMDHEDGDHDDMEGMDQAEDEVERVPNDGAVITILSPRDGATFANGEDVLVEVEVENFDLTDPEQHWHVYVDGLSWGMVEGANTDSNLRGLSPGEHVIRVYMSVEGHMELQDGDTITVKVSE